jgi:competence protein ComEA
MKHDTLKKRKIRLLAVCMLAAGICYSCKNPREALNLGQQETLEESEAFGAREELSEGEDGADKITERSSEASEEMTEAEALICVHVCGCVKYPGVYELPQNSRVYEAIEAAGGFTEEGARDFLNLAMELEDTMKVEVPGLEQIEQWQREGKLSQAGFPVSSLPEAAYGDKQAALVNLNTASMEELMTLKGIGESRAGDIIRYRQEAGGFQAIEDIMNVPGIKEGAFEKIKDYITV